MPIVCRNVEPTHLGACEVPQNEDNEKKCVLWTVANNAVVGLLLQLSSLVRHADDLFCDISDESVKVFERIDKLSKRIHGLNSIVSKLDAKQVTIPEGDLKQFTAITNHHQARHGYDAALFLSTNRPQCIRDQYNLCAPNPARVIRSADPYRKDGLNGSKMFKCWPVITNEPCIRTPDLNMPRRVQRVRSFEKKYKPPRIRERPKTIHGWDDFTVEEIKREIEEGKKIQRDKCHLPTSTPEVVSINISGANFERMQSLRSSCRKTKTNEETAKKKKRRRTVSGIENIMHEIEKFEGKKKISKGGARQTPRSHSFDDLDTDNDDDFKRDEGIVKYLDELDGKMEEKMGEETAQKIMKFFPCRRSRSLPRCMKLTFVSRSLSAERKSQKNLSTSSVSSSLSIASLASSVSRLSRSSKKSTMIGNKIKSLVSGSIKERPKPRPKSLDIDTILDSKPRSNLIEEHERSKSTCNLERNHTQNILDNSVRKNDVKSSNATIGPGSYYNFESSTLPRAQARKYDFPWESLPKDWTTSVKLREISKEDRQSSSGNWSQSGTSSNRQSLDSDLRSETLKFTSQYSFGKDSGRDSLTLEDHNDCVTDGTSTAGYAADGTSTITGDSVTSGNPKADFTHLETEAWIQSLAVRAANQEEALSNIDKSSTLSRLTRQNILALDLMLSDGKPRAICDEDSSVYSVDQEGFYTSFHNDSGLKKSTNTLLCEDTISQTRDSSSICSVESVIHNPKGNAKFAVLKKGSRIKQTKILNKVTPPTPPLRTSSCTSYELRSQDNVNQLPQLYSYPSQESSIFGSDIEVVLNCILDKTNLTSTTGFPSLVALSTSDDESSPDNTSHQLRKSKNHIYCLNTNDSDLGLFAIKDTSQVSVSCLSSILDSSKSDPCHLASNISLRQSKSALECINQGYDSYTLPVNKNCENKSEPGYQSWPRSYRGLPTSGILKTPEKQHDGVKTLKTLNFAPVVNLFKEGAKSSVEVPLPSPTNSSSSDSNNPSTLFSSLQAPIPSQDQTYALSIPIHAKSKSKSSKKCSSPSTQLLLKYQPVITVTPRSRSGDQNRSSKDRSRSLGQTFVSNKTELCSLSSVKSIVQSTPQHTINSLSNRQISDQENLRLHTISPAMAPKDPSRQKSLKSAGSLSSLTPSDNRSVNNSTTYVNMSSPNSSPNLSTADFSVSCTAYGSVDSLLDMRKTPTNELENDSYQISANHYNSKGKVGKDDKSRNCNNIPVVLQTTVRNDKYSIQNGGQQSSANLGTIDYMRDKLITDNWTVGSAEVDLTREIQMLFESSMGSIATPASRQSTIKCAGDKRQMGRQSRSDVQNETSYNNYNVTNRRALQSDVSNSVQIRSVSLNDTRPGSNQNDQISQKTMSSSKSYPLGFNSVLLSNSSYNSGPFGVNPNNQIDTRRKGDSPGPVPSFNGEQFSSRSDSYRVAMGNSRTNSQSRSAMAQSQSLPVFPATRNSGPFRVAMDMSPNRTFNQIEDDATSRADSYRIAVRNTNGIAPPDIPNHYTSYHAANTNDNHVIVTTKRDAIGMDNIKSTSDKDVRKMRNADGNPVRGLTAKSPKNDASIIHSQVRLRNKGGKRNSNSVSTMKESKPSSQTEGGRIRKVTTHDVDPIEVVQTVDNKSNNKKLDKNSQNRSSTYIQFDPIFEDTEDFSNIAHLDMSSSDYSINLSHISKSQFGLINGMMKNASVKTMKK